MPKIEPRWTLGNIIIIVQLALFGVAGVAGYTTLTNKVEAGVGVLNDHEVRIRALENRVMDQLGRIEMRLQHIERAIQ